MSKAIYMPVFTPFRVSQVALVIKNLSANAGDIRDTGSIPRSGRSPGGGNGNPLQFSCLKNPHGQRNLWATVHGGHKELDTTEGLTCTHTKEKKNNQTGR